MFKSEKDRDVTELFKKYKAHEGEDRIRRFPPQPRCIASNPAALKPLAPRQTVPQCPAADESKFYVFKLIYTNEYLSIV